MKKHFLILALCASILFVGCKKDNDPAAEPTIDEIVNLPYSSLKPDEQKVKMENESTALLDMANATKTSVSIEAVQSLEHFLGKSSIELVGGEKTTSLQQTFEYANVFGIYTWNSQKNDWDKTASNKELKFLFPAKEGDKSNTASLTVSAVASNASVVLSDTEYGHYDEESGVWDYNTRVTKTTYYLPSSAKGVVMIGSTQAAIIELTAEYNGSQTIPTKFNFSINLSDGYKLTSSFNKAAESVLSSALTLNGKAIFSAVAKSNIKGDEIFDNMKADKEVGYALFGNDANAVVKIMDNFVVVFKGDVANLTKEIDALDAKYDKKWEELWEANRTRETKDYYTKHNQLSKGYCDEYVAIKNKYQSAVLASTKESTKIADLIFKSELDYSYTTDLYWDNQTNRWENAYRWDWEDDHFVQVKVHDPDPNAVSKYYREVAYFKFGDGTEVAASAYFSAGFDSFTQKWNDLVKAFNR